MAPSEDVLLISMDSQHSKGQEDLYVSVKENDQWSKPQHLGDVINTGGYEIAPFLSAGKDSLYFTSNGHGGLGDGDLFVATRTGKDWNEWSAPVNLGAPFNSAAFDGYYFEQDKKAYFSSDRDGNHDIFAVDLSKSAPEEKTDIAADEPLQEDRLSAATNPDSVATNEEEFPEQLANKATSQTRVVYYDFDRSTLDAAGKKILDELSNEIMANREAKVAITLTGFSDDIGTEAYNLRLSENRAREVMAYLQSKGIDKSLMTIDAKGEQKNDGGSDRADRAENRRIEIVVVVNR